MSQIKQAELLARAIHYGQKRWDGEDYITHCERIVDSLSLNFFVLNGEEEYSFDQVDMLCAAWLHDCVEDSNSPLCVKTLIQKIFNSRVSELVNVLTHDIDVHFYTEYLYNVSRNSNALEIKWADMIGKSVV